MPEKNAMNELLLQIAKDLKEIKDNQARMELKIDAGFSELKSRTTILESDMYQVKNKLHDQIFEVRE